MNFSQGIEWTNGRREQSRQQGSVSSLVKKPRAPLKTVLNFRQVSACD